MNDFEYIIVVKNSGGISMRSFKTFFYNATRVTDNELSIEKANATDAWQRSFCETMRKLSIENRGVIFIAHAFHENGGEKYRQYFLNGKTQYVQPRTVFDPFDTEKLHEIPNR